MASSRKNLVQLILLAVLVALIALLGLTPLGLIPLGFINVTILCIPVIIGTLYLDWKKGLVLGLTFGAVSLYSAFTKPSALVATLLSASPVLTIIMTIVPRLCIPIVAWFVYQNLSKKTEEQAKRSAFVVFGSLTATLFGLVILLILFFSKALQLPNVDETVSYTWSRNNVFFIMGCIVLFALLCGFAASLFVSGKWFQETVVKHAPVAVAAVCGSLTNTVLYLGMMLLFYIMCGIDTAAVLGLIGGTALIAGLSEAAVAAVLVPPILSAVKRIRIR